MKLNFRDLKQQKFTIDAEPSDTILQVKERIAGEKGWEASSQKLIYSGKILADANTVESYKIEEKGFIVCMVSKPKAPPAAKPAAAAAAATAPPPATPQVSSSTPAPPPAPQAATSGPTADPPATPTPAAVTSPSSGPSGFGDPSAMMVGNRSEAAIQNMMEMGFDRPDIDRAMRAAHYNPDRAIDYLLNGIPESILAEQRAQQQARQAPAAGATEIPGQPTAAATPAAPAPAAAPSTESAGEVNLFEAAAQAGQTGTGRGTGAAGAARSTGTTAPSGQMDMDFLRNNAHFQQLRQLVQQQPAMLEPILQQVAEGNPQLVAMIGNNQEQFLQLLSEDLAGGEGGALPPGAISVTQEESDAIDRLCGLGFPRERVIQAYFACDKNEELAAHFLFEQLDEDDD